MSSAPTIIAVLLMVELIRDEVFLARLRMKPAIRQPGRHIVALHLVSEARKSIEHTVFYDTAIWIIGGRL
jgi:hypothetical protein